eukprot:TRINITY_DN25412_c0_g1_i1.p1 TRINITY_DN25412_c0_g1~~TRINITY_DN25412_c0_g1_i1.p1  ORF type:complete len:651 (+),score=205.19 TRINITY_DN25412_c0_g1_i1:86-1954(+)
MGEVAWAETDKALGLGSVSPATTVVQVAIIYVICLLWFADGIPGLWTDVLQRTSLGEILMRQGVRPEADSGWRHSLFAVVSSGWHSVLVCVGLWLGHQSRRLCPRVRAVAIAVLLSTFAAVVHFVLRSAFDARTLAVRDFADCFFNENGREPFALMGSLSMTIWLCVSMIFSHFDRRMSGLMPEVVTRYLPWILSAWGAAVCFFRFACVPLWNGVLRHAAREVLHADRDPLAFPEVRGDAEAAALARLASCTHTLALALGVATCGTANTALRHLRSAGSQPATSQAARALRNLVVFTALCGGFVFALWQWLNFAFEKRVTHVTMFTRAFFGSWADLVPAHVVVLVSYALWFSGGVLFEQFWRSSASNHPPDEDELQRARGLGALLLRQREEAAELRRALQAERTASAAQAAASEGALAAARARSAEDAEAWGEALRRAAAEAARERAAAACARCELAESAGRLALAEEWAAGMPAPALQLACAPTQAAGPPAAGPAAAMPAAAAPAPPQPHAASAPPHPPSTAEAVAEEAFNALTRGLCESLQSLRCGRPWVDPDAKGYSVVYPVEETPSAPLTDFLRRRLNPKLKETAPFKGKCVRVNLLSLRDACAATHFGDELEYSYAW